MAWPPFPLVDKCGLGNYIPPVWGVHHCAVGRARCGVALASTAGEAAGLLCRSPTLMRALLQRRALGSGCGAVALALRPPLPPCSVQCAVCTECHRPVPHLSCKHPWLTDHRSRGRCRSGDGREWKHQHGPGAGPFQRRDAEGAHTSELPPMDTCPGGGSGAAAGAQGTHCTGGPLPHPSSPLSPRPHSCHPYMHRDV